jgi:hypothetical protein
VIRNGQDIEVYDGTQKMCLSYVSLKAAYGRAIDKSSVVTFRLQTPGAPTEPGHRSSEHLMALVAGGKKAGKETKPAVVTAKPQASVMRRPAALVADVEAYIELQQQYDDQQSSEDDVCDVDNLDATSPDDEATVLVGDKILALMKKEVQDTLKSDGLHRDSVSHQQVCPLCPWRQFPHKSHGVERMKNHIKNYHTLSRQYCCSGTKQLKVVIALYDNDVLMRRAPLNLLHRSADIFRASVIPGVDCNTIYIDKHIRMILAATGPVFVHVNSISESLWVRRIRNLYISCEFAERLIRELMLNKCKMAAVYPILLAYIQSTGSELANLLPQHPSVWWPIIEDLFTSPAVLTLRQELVIELEKHEEYIAISIDATMRSCMPIIGQAHPRASRAVKAAAAIGEADCLRRILTVRGRTGAVLLMLAVKAEKAEETAQAISDNFSISACGQVKYISVDNPSAKLINELTPSMPNLSVMALDPVHLAIAYEYSTWRILVCIFSAISI